MSKSRADRSEPGSKGQTPRKPAYPEPMDRLIEEFARLPGIGRRSAERLAFHVLKNDEESALRLAKALSDVKRAVRSCSRCFNLCDDDPCPICAGADRDQRLIMVVEQAKDVVALEQTGMHKGVYHVLMGRLSPLEGIGPGDLTIAALLERVEAMRRAGAVEVILGLNPTLEGDGTALYLAQELKARGASVTRLARGLPAGGQLEYANKAVLADAIAGRQRME